MSVRRLQIGNVFAFVDNSVNGCRSWIRRLQGNNLGLGRFMMDHQWQTIAGIFHAEIEEECWTFFAYQFE
jgi:hypothetical protein